MKVGFRGGWKKHRGERKKRFLTQKRLLGNFDPAAFRRQHPCGNLQPLPGLVDDRHRAISTLRLTKDLKADTMERVERIDDLDIRGFHTQGIVGAGVC